LDAQNIAQEKQDINEKGISMKKAFPCREETAVLENSFCFLLLILKNMLEFACAGEL
jgi:hypothetical protein